MSMSNSAIVFSASIVPCSPSSQRRKRTIVSGLKSMRPTWFANRSPVSLSSWNEITGSFQYGARNSQIASYQARTFAR